MSDRRFSRRDFIVKTSQAAAVAAAAGGVGRVEAAASDKVVNHNPKMKYRKMGKTGLMVSEVSLG